MGEINELEDFDYNSRLNRVFTFFIFITLFFSSYIFFKTPFEGYFSYIIIILLLPFFMMRYVFPSKVIAYIVLLIILGVINVALFQENSYSQLIKIGINIIISTLFYNYVFQVYRFNIKFIFTQYANLAYWVSVIGIAQVIFYQIGFSYGYSYKWILNKWALTPGGFFGIRLNAIFSEPSYFAAALAPAFFIAVYNIIFVKQFFFTKIRSIIIIVAYFLTFSSVAYMGIFLTILLIAMNYGFLRIVMVGMPILIGAYFILYTQVPEFRSRIDGLAMLNSGEKVSSFDVHGSSFVLYNNIHVATENFKRNPIWGTGLGSHEFAYNKYSLVEKFGGIYDFNKSDANSMLLRLVSETGLMGVFFIFYFLKGNFVLRHKDDSNEMHWLISNAALLIILLQLLRQGNYTYNGFLFYMWLYFFTYKDYINTIDVEEIEK